MRGFEPFRPRSATRLSGPRPARTATFGLFVALARLSLGLGCLLTLSSCLVDDPPPYNQPTQTPPRIDYHGAAPLLDQVIVAKSLDTIEFIIPFTSEDAGEGLNAFLLFDYKGGDLAQIAAFKSIQPSTQADPRKVSLTLQVAGSPGCHRITLRIGHISSLPQANFHPTVNTADIAEAYWWMNVDADPALGNSLSDCPVASRSQP
jgi:hypothetical protein